ncbi:MAG: hypothetical protein ACRD29_00415 [Acidimicrobiales bacterium]
MWRFPAIFRGVAESTLPDDATLAGLDRPALVLAWTGDSVHPVSTATRLGELLPRAEVDVDYDAERIARWPERVAGFLDAHT